MHVYSCEGTLNIFEHGIVLQIMLQLLNKCLLFFIYNYEFDNLISKLLIIVYTKRLWTHGGQMEDKKLKTNTIL